uniref:Uncharacterized protein n=1 Tax=Triticum urartu TaxID=4572 RepID=A0A8R7VJX1_TRIUA
YLEVELAVVPILLGFAAERLIFELIEDLVRLISHPLDLLKPSLGPFSVGRRLLSIGNDVQDGQQLAFEDPVLLLHTLHHLVLVQQVAGRLLLHNRQQWPNYHGGHQLCHWSAQSSRHTQSTGKY